MSAFNMHVVRQLCSTRTMDEILAIREQVLQGCCQPNLWFESPSLEDIDTAIALYNKAWFVECRKTTFKEDTQTLSIAPLATLKKWKRQIKNGTLSQKDKEHLEGDFQWNILTIIDTVIAKYDCEEFRECRRKEKYWWMFNWLTAEDMECILADIQAGCLVTWPHNFDYERVSAEDIKNAIVYEKEYDLACAKELSEYMIDRLRFGCSMEDLLRRKKYLEDGNSPGCPGTIDEATLEEINAAIATYWNEDNVASQQKFKDCFGHMPYEKAK